jgi:hypothetical protein
LQNFEQMVKDVRNKYSFIPSLKGKKVLNNIFIISQLATKGESSCWDLALDYIKTVRAKDYSNWCADPHAKSIIYHERQNVNGVLYKSLKFLVQKHYVEKEDSRYSLTLKGIFLAFMLNPETLRNCAPRILNIPNSKIQEIAKKSNVLPVTPKTGALTGFRVFLQNLHENPLAYKFIRSVLEVFLEQIVVKYKMNLDEISEETFESLMHNELKKLIVKYYKKYGVEVEDEKDLTKT